MCTSYGNLSHQVLAVLDRPTTRGTECAGRALCVRLVHVFLVSRRATPPQVAPPQLARLQARPPQVAPPQLAARLGQAPQVADRLPPIADRLPPFRAFLDVLDRNP